MRRKMLGGKERALGHRDGDRDFDERVIRASGKRDAHARDGQPGDNPAQSRRLKWE
jgi:hypothetical protein